MKIKVFTLMAVCVIIATQALAVNLVINGDFEFDGGSLAPNGSDYATSNIYDPGQYVVANSPANVHVLWADYQPFDQYQMIVNGSDINLSQRVWFANNIAVSPATNYVLSAWVRSCYPDSDQGNLYFAVNGIPVGNIIPAFGQWTQFNGQWYSGADTTVNLAAIYDLNFAYTGNDYSIDNISFSASAAPLPPSALLFGSSLACLALIGLRKRG